MHITIKCFATLSRFTPKDADAFSVTPGESVGSVVARLGIPLGELKLVFVNGAHCALDTPLADGDRVGLFPAVGGG